MASGIRKPMIGERPASSEGLTTEEVLARRRQYGANTLPAEKPPSALSILFAQLKSPLIYIILVAAGISLVVGELGDFAIIMAVVVIDVILGFIQEYQAQRTYTALKSLLKPTTTVLRDGERQEVEVTELVPGDLVLLNAGEHVPGDGEIVEGTKLTVDEAILTGESEPINKGRRGGPEPGLHGHDRRHRAWDHAGRPDRVPHRARADRHQPAGARRGRHAPAGAAQGVQQDADAHRRRRSPPPSSSPAS